jgi:KDO2-lipid IV(A) lauroyltransferase
MLRLLLGALARLPLSWLQALGAGLGWIVYLTSRTYATRLDANLRQSRLYTSEAQYRQLRRAAVAEAGRGALEVFAVWFKPDDELRSFVREVRNLEAVERARASGRGILLLTPHLGCFEIAGFFFAQMLPMTILYRPPRLRRLEPLMIEGRRRGHAQLATTDVAGVRRLLRALRAGNAAGLLPDQAPRFGEGVPAEFFGRPAHTMTLVNRLRRATSCATFMVFAERLPRGAGYRMHIAPLPDTIGDESELNRAVESMIRMRPEQYLWGYDRYTIPRQAVAPLLGEPHASG